MVLRAIPNTVLTMEQIGLPNSVKDVLYKPRGLVLVRISGSGKSTTLASMINIINENKKDHIITIEDPIEFYHNHKSSVVTQREVHNDVPSFAEAIRQRLAPGSRHHPRREMRDLKRSAPPSPQLKPDAVLRYALHTTGAAETIDRIVDSFPTTQQEQVKTQLATCLVCVISQVFAEEN